MRSVSFFLLLVILPVSAFATPLRTTSPTAAAAYLAEQLVSNLQIRLDRSQPIVPTVFVHLDDVSQASPLGRLLAEMTANALAGHGFTLTELRLRAESLAIHPHGGEFALSREHSAIASPVPTHAILAGTYAPAGHVLTVSARIVHATTHMVLSTATCEILLTPATRQALTPDHPRTPPSSQSPLPRPAAAAEVKAIQSRLKELGLYHAQIDGIWGKQTQRAIDAFRRIRGILAQTPWDTTTRDALLGS
jgi:hypothetical protein